MPHRRPFGAAFATVHVVSTGPPWRWLREIFVAGARFFLARGRKGAPRRAASSALRPSGRRSRGTASYRKSTTRDARGGPCSCAMRASCKLRWRNARAWCASSRRARCDRGVWPSLRRELSTRFARQDLSIPQIARRLPDAVFGAGAPKTHLHDRSRGAPAEHMPTLDRALRTSLHLESVKLC